MKNAFRSLLRTLRDRRRGSLCLLLCAAMLLSCIAMPSFAALGAEEPPDDETEEPVALTVLRFDLGDDTVIQRAVPAGENPPLPDTGERRVYGWLDEDGRVVWPDSFPAGEDTSYTAIWEKSVSTLLNTDDHFAYVQGDKGLFRPDVGITRGEAAQMFYGLLRRQNWSSGVKFSDVGSQWYADAVNAMAGLGILKGYSDGTFRAGQYVTRAEFTAMAVGFLEESGETVSSFPDVTPGYWAAPAIHAAVSAGWIKGFSDGKFHPNDRLTRAQAVTIVNHMLGRGADPAVKDWFDVKNFYDVFPNHWAYNDIEEAATGHVHTLSESGQEYWIQYDKDTVFPSGSKFMWDGMALYYLDASTRKFLRGDQVIGGKTYVLDPVNGAAFTGFRAEGEYGRYYREGLPTDGVKRLVDPATKKTYNGFRAEGEYGQYYADGLPADGVKRLVDPATGKAYTGFRIQGETGEYYENGLPKDGVKRVADLSTGTPLTGFKMKDGWRRYYKEGILQEDISNLGVVSGPYFIKVYKNNNYVIVFARDSSGSYNTPVKAMLASCGYSTITGTYYTPNRWRWLRMVGYVWGQWVTQISGNYLFHSVPSYTQSNADLEVEEFNHLGETRSAGCVRLNCADAKWIYDNCALGTKVEISSWETVGPLAKPKGIQVPSWHTWDPTDPTAHYLCEKYGCH